ncbi:2OG-Fe(II)-dependent halogenase WelO5 family protein [Streptomyces roseoverticillatus]|uniref:Proline hydroxylase n=1 Tax=Streptomyces roseoverticillatus TaxID=66429 RepID=A0ABV3IWE9_9ACTN
MTPGDLHDPFFCAATSTGFTRARISDLAAGRCAALRVPDLLPRRVVEETLEALEARAFDAYGRKRVSPPVMRFGVGVSDYCKNGTLANAYWPAVDTHRKDWEDLGLPFDPFEECRAALGADWPGGIRVGRRSGREMGAGVAREPNQGFRVHFDDTLREFFRGDLLDSTIVTQFAFNMYLSVPESGGETIIWRHRWDPADEAFRLPGSYGYDESVVGDVESIELSPEVGEAVLLNPHFFHAVRPSRGARRIALGFAVGLSVTGELLTWG